jgi:hypothetical protein
MSGGSAGFSDLLVASHDEQVYDPPMPRSSVEGSAGTVRPSAAEARNVLREVVRGFDPTVISAADAAELVTVFAEIERLAGSARLLAAGRMARTSVWAGDGDTDVAAWMARHTGQSRADARRDVAAARALDGLDDTRDAIRRGELTKEQVREIAPTAVLAPGSERDLLAEAASGSVDRLADRARATKAAARRDGRDAVERIRRRRSVTHGAADDGGHWVRAYGSPDDVARLLAGLTPWAQAAGTAARRRGEALTDEQARFDGLVAMAGAPGVPTASSERQDADDAGDLGDLGEVGEVDVEPGGQARTRVGVDRPTAGGPRTHTRWATKVIVNVDLSALRRGFALPGERCSITGIGPVPVATVDDLLDREDTFVAAVLRDGEDIQSVAHLGRGPSARQRTALEARHDRCCIDGCPDPPLVVDHQHRFADGGARTLDNLGPLCGKHDRRKTHEGWVLVRHGRSRRLVPPSHPLGAGAVPGGCVDLDDPPGEDQLSHDAAGAVAPSSASGRQLDLLSP